MIVEDLTRSCYQVAAYWRALQKHAIAAWPDDYGTVESWPARSWVLSHIAYGGRSAIDAAALRTVARTSQQSPVLIDYDSMQVLGVRHAADLEPIPVSQLMRDRLGQALELLARAWPQAFEELRLCADSICTFDGLAADGFSNPKLFGCVFIHRRVLEHASSVFLAERLVHEAGHHALFVETSLDRLIPEDYSKNIYSPLRGEVRPALGVLHAAIALGRMIAWLQIARVSAVDFHDVDHARLDSHVRCYEQTLHELRGIRFSEHGQQLYEAFCRHYEKVKKS